MHRDERDHPRSLARSVSRSLCHTLAASLSLSLSLALALSLSLSLSLYIYIYIYIYREWGEGCRVHRDERDHPRASRGHEERGHVVHSCIRSVMLSCIQETPADSSILNPEPVYDRAALQPHGQITSLHASSSSSSSLLSLQVLEGP